MDELRCKIVFEGNTVSLLGINCETSIVDGELRIQSRSEWIKTSERLPEENKKFLAWDDDDLQIIYDIYNYAKNHPRFDTKYVDSIQDYLAENGYITSNQYNALVNVYYSFRMDKFKEEESKK